MGFYGKGMRGTPFSVQQAYNPGPLGDGVANMWNPQLKGDMSEAENKAVSIITPLDIRTFCKGNEFKIIVSCWSFSLLIVKSQGL